VHESDTVVAGVAIATVANVGVGGRVCIQATRTDGLRERLCSHRCGNEPVIPVLNRVSAGVSMDDK